MSSEMLIVAAILVLLVLSSMFSGSETAITAASRPRLFALERKGNRRARLVARIREEKDLFLSAILIANNLVNITASALATSVLIAWFGEAGIAYATVAMTALVVVFGEVLPKTLALRNPDRLALAAAPFVRAVMTALSPVAHATRLLVAGLLRAVGAYRAEPAAEAAAEELRGAIELHAAPDPSVRKERRMLRSILDLADVEVGQIMVHRRQIYAIDADLPPAAILEQALSSAHTRIPLYRGQIDNITGVLHAKALLRALRANRGNPDAIRIAEVATRPWFIPESTTLLDQLEAFRRRREHFALVVDEYGALLGVVTLEDILEEIVGDIAEHHEVKVPGVSRQGDGSFAVDGHVTLRDLNREFDWHLPDDQADTLAGLILHEARRIPDVGQTFNFHGFRFEILRRKRNQVAAIRVTPPGAARPAPARAGTPATT